jgi:hypothetical protein
MPDSPQHTLTEAEMRVLFRYALHLIPRGVLQDLLGSADRREKGLGLATGMMVDHFRKAKHVIVRGPGAPNHG